MTTSHSTKNKLATPAFVNDDNEPDINADFAAFVRVNCARLDWQPSPAAGVMRKRLELVHGDVKRITSLVRFDPGSQFDEHGHPNGEEFLVLSGTFSDHSGDYHAGSYVRNPDTWVHAPWTENGCELFVKLRQFQKNDQQRVSIATHSVSWHATEHDGVLEKPLHHFLNESVKLYKFESDSTRLFNFEHAVEILVLNGTLTVNGHHHSAYDWLRSPIKSSLSFSSKEGCVFYCKQGHIPAA